MRCTFALILVLGLSVGCESNAPPSFKPLTAQQYRQTTRSRTTPSTSRRIDMSSHNARTYRTKLNDLPTGYQKHLQRQSATDPDGSPKVNVPN